MSTDQYVATLAGLAAVFPSRMIAAQESSSVAIDYVVPDADTTPAPTSAFVSVHYTVTVVDRGQSQSRTATWSLHVIVFNGAWRIDAIAQA